MEETSFVAAAFETAGGRSGAAGNDHEDQQQRAGIASDSSYVSANRRAVLDDGSFADAELAGGAFPADSAIAGDGAENNKLSRIQAALRQHFSSTSGASCSDESRHNSASDRPGPGSGARSSSSGGEALAGSAFSSVSGSQSSGSTSSTSSVIIHNPLRKKRRGARGRGGQCPAPGSSGNATSSSATSVDFDVIVEEEDDDDPSGAFSTLAPITEYQRANAISYSISDEGKKAKSRKGLFKGLTRLTRNIMPSRPTGDQAGSPDKRSNTVSAQDVFDDDSDATFLQEVECLRQNEGLPYEQALHQCRVKRLIAEKGSAENALFFLLEKSSLGLEVKAMLDLVFNLATIDVTQVDEAGKTFLHYVARGRSLEAAETLITQKVPTGRRDDSGRYAVEYALDNSQDKMSALLISAMNNEDARSLFLCEPVEGVLPRYNFHAIVSNRKMRATAQAIMDTMIEKIDSEQYKFYFAVMETDSSGRPPDHPNFSAKKGLAYAKVADSKELRSHNLLRILIHHKWAKYGESKAIKALLLYLCYVTLCSFAFMTAVGKRTSSFQAATNVSEAIHGNPLQYDSFLDYTRLAIEILMLILTAASLLAEGLELKQSGVRNYLREPSNYYQVFTSLSFFALIPLRVSQSFAQWEFMAVLYMLVTMRILVSISILRITGIYLQILVKIMVRDMVRFSIIYCIFLLAFSGSTYLLLGGSDYPESNGLTGTDLDRTDELSDYPHIVVTLLRIMVQNENVGTYFGTGYFWPTILLRILYLFMVLIVLLNILIAQLSDTYAEIKQDAQLNLERNWCNQLLESEKTRFWDKKGVLKVYDATTIVACPQKLLLTWEEPVDFEAKLNEEHQRRLVEQQLYKLEQLLFSMRSQQMNIMKASEAGVSVSTRVADNIPVANLQLQQVIQQTVEECTRRVVAETSAGLQNVHKALRMEMQREMHTMAADTKEDLQDLKRLVEKIPTTFPPPPKAKS
eukprot:scpid20096/ scgid1534/ Transient receptor potential cation channel subfamily V member 4; Osm-9-like TRP channel 4; Transient receptor potential protein 12; Vanilloid receptor-like channel 2; Vanilloid receptor-like protein 2; Vanilloid receptor-related osmotically-activated channel